jgi:hypothetical protein
MILLLKIVSLKKYFEYDFVIENIVVENIVVEKMLWL